LITYLIHADLFGRIFGRLFGIKKIICSRQGSLLQWDFLKYFDWLTKGLVTRYTALTEVEKSILIRTLGIKKEKIIINPNGIEMKEFDFEIDRQKKKNELGIQNENINIVCVSKLRNGKGHEYLLNAFEALYEKNNKINLLLVGGGERESFLIDCVSNYESKGNIYFLGNRNDAKEILKISDIFVMPTLAEGMSIAILEAMASGLPIITTNIPANKVLIQDKETGILVSPKNAPEIAEKISILVNDADLRQKMGHAAKKRAESEFNLDLAVKRFIEFLNDI
jgi:glycosyltransferase involved in cell wall biosynthesis